jgi:hypothetical protein
MRIVPFGMSPNVTLPLEETFGANTTVDDSCRIGVAEAA